MSEKMKGWHFLREDGCLQYSPHTRVKVGQTLTYEGPLYLCESGLHASRNILDALTYAPGPILCRVELSGVIVHGNDKTVAQQRTVFAMADATELLRSFARAAALSVVHLWDAHDVVMRYLLTGDEGIRAAARAAAWDAAWTAARDAAWNVAWTAARAAAWTAARIELNAVLTEYATELLGVE
jgi:hypothetical protein